MPVITSWKLALVKTSTPSSSLTSSAPVAKATAASKTANLSETLIFAGVSSLVPTRLTPAVALERVRPCEA